jgi:hypothetical protein
MQQAKGYTIKDFVIHLDPKSNASAKFDAVRGNQSTINIQKLCSAFNYIESIDSPSIRCEFMIGDTIDLISGLNGNEIIEVEVESMQATGKTLKIKQQIFKIGEITKNERAVQYILYTVSPHIITNESKKVFKSFMGVPASDAVKKILKDHLSVGNDRPFNFEDTRGNFNFISPSWRALDAISYITDKCVSGKLGLSGYMFFENQSAYNFVTIDSLCSGENKNNVPKYKYEQANVGSDDLNLYKVESISFPARANHLEKMRTGAYSNTVIGIKVPALTSGALPSEGGGQGKDGPSGSIKPPINMSLMNVFGLAKNKGCILNDSFPFPKIDPSFFSDKVPTRMKIRALPGMKNSSSSGDSTASAQNMDFDTLSASAYSFSRWQLLNAITLDIKVPGNVVLEAGRVIELEIPQSGQETNRVEIDPTYSGYYLIRGLTHSYTPEGITTHLNLCKDSISSR